MDIQEARHVAKEQQVFRTEPGAHPLILSALTMAAALDQIEQACSSYGDYDADGLLHDISDILGGKRQ